MFTKTLKLLVLVGALAFSYKSFAQPTFVVQNVKGSCEGFPNGSFDVLVTSASGSVNLFYFSGPLFGGPFPATVGTPVTISGLAGAPFPGRVYQLVVQDAVDFSTTNVNIISYPTPLSITIDNVADNTDCVTSNGSISVTPAGGSGSYTFSWVESTLGFTANTEDISSLLGGNYTLTITDNNTNCVETFPPIVIANPSPVLFNLDNTPSPTPVCSGSNLTLSLDGSEAGATYEVFRNNVIATGITQVGTGAPLNFTVPFGTFSNGDNFKIRATNGICVGDMANIVIVSIIPLPTASIAGTATICSGGSTNLTFTLPAGTYDVVYTDGTTNFNATGISNGATVSVSPTVNTTYTIVSVTNTATLCTSTAPSPNITGSAVISVNPSPTASIAGTATICAGGSTLLTFTLPSPGSFNVVYTDGTTNFNANGISNGATVSVNPTVNTTYTIVSVTDVATSCTASAPNPGITGSAIVTVNPLPTASISGTVTICSGNNAVLTFTLSAGTYDVVYTDGTTNVTLNGISNGATVNVNPAANTTYSIISVTNTAIASCTVTAPSPNITGSAVVTVNPSPTASISGTAAICNGANAVLMFTLPATGTYDVVYTDGTTNFNATGISNGATVNVNPTANTTYTIVSVTNTATSCSSIAPSPNITGSAVITVNSLPTASISGTSTICLGNSATLTFTLPATGTFNVVYTDGTTNFNANGISNGATVSVSPTANTTYTIVSVTDVATTCSVTAPSPNITGNAVVTVNPLPTASISGTATICSGNSVTLTFTLPAPGTFDVVYTDGTTNFNANGITNGATVNVTPAASATYTIVSVTNTVSLCTVTAPSPNITGSAVVTVNPLPTASISGTATICSGGTTALTFTLPSPGTFDVVYTDGTTNFNANGIANGATVNVSPTSTTTYTIVSVTNTVTTCAVTAPSPNITGTAVVTVDPLPTASISGTATICAGASTALTFTLPAGTYNVVYTDGTTNFNANGISNNATVNVSPTANTTYTIVSVTNTTTTCSVTAPSPNITGSAIITVDPLPTASIAGTATICGGGSATLTFNLSVGTFNVVYTDGTSNFNANGISNGATVNVTPTVTTTYTIVSVTNTTSTCSVTAPNPNITGSAVVTVAPLPTAVTSGGGTVCAGSPLPDVTFTFTGTAPFTFTYTDGTTPVTVTSHPSTTFTVSAAPVGTYEVTALSDGNACVATSFGGSVSVAVAPQPTITATPIAPVCLGATSASLVYTATTGAPDQYIIDFNGAAQSAGFVDVLNATLTASPVSITVPGTAPAGTYNGNLFVRNSTSGCLSSPTPISITVAAGPTATISGTTTICTSSTSNLTVNFTGTGPWTFTYSDGTTTSAPINSAFSAFVIPVAPSATTTYTLVSVSDASATACPGSVSGSAVVTVNQTPQTNLTVGVTIDPLCSGGVSEVTVANSQTGVSYQLRNDAGDVPVGAAVVGTGGTINLSTGPLSATTTFNVLATAMGCTSVELTNLATVNVAGSVNGGLAVTAVDNTLCSGNSTIIQVANTENGVLYQLRNDADDSNIGTAVAGTGATIDLPTGNLTATTVFNVLASNGTCSIELADIETVTVSPSPDPSLAVAVTLDPLCAGGSTTITVALSEVGISYQLRNDVGDVPVGAAIAGTGGTIVFPTGALAATTTFNVLATGTGCPPIELTTLATVTVSGNVDATLSVVAAANPICEGTGTDIQIAGSETGINYQLRDDATDTPVGAPVAGTGGTILLPTGNLTATTTFNVLATNGVCSIELVDLETVNVDVAPDAGLAVNVTLDPLCVGGVSAVTVALSQAGVTYQLRNNADDSNVGAPVAGTGGTISLSTGVLNATTAFNILATSGGCTAIELTTIATVTVTGNINAALVVTPSTGTVCIGNSAFIQVQASEVGINYQLRNDLDDSPIGTALPGNGSTLNLPTGNLTTTTTFNVVASNGTCSIELTETETINAAPLPLTNLPVNATSTLICSGASTSIIVTGSQNGVSYQLRDSDNGNLSIGGIVMGTGGDIVLPVVNLTTTKNINIFAMLGSCGAQLATTVTITIRPPGDPACGGGGSNCTNFAAIVPTIVTQPSCNDRDAGEVSFTIARADGTPTTFRVLWTIGGTTQTKFTSSTVSFDDLSSGAYQYTVIDEGNGLACGPVDFFLDLKTQVEILDKQVTANVTCFGGTDGNAILTVDGTTTGEYWYKYVLDGVESSAQTFTPGAPFPGGLPADDDDFLIIKVDETFNFLCPDTVMVRIRHTFPMIDYAVASTDVTTCNGTDGSILVSSIAGGDSGSNPLQVRLKKAVPFTTDPSGYVVLIDYEDVVNGEKEYLDLSQGNYVVDVKDHLDCIQSRPIAVQAPGQVPLTSVTITPVDATACLSDGSGASGSITVAISDAGLFEVALSQDPLNFPDDDQYIDYSSPSLPSVTFSDLSSGAYYIYLKSSTTTCPTRTDAINIGGFQAINSFDVVSNCENPNLLINNITGQIDASFVIRVFDNDDKFFKIDSLTSSSIPLSKSVTFVYNPPLQHSFLVMPGSYRFVMVQTQTFGTNTCTLVSDTVVYDVRLGLNITLGKVKPSFPDPKRTGSIEVADIDGGTRFVSPSNELYYEVALYDADDDVVVEDWTQVKLDPQNKFTKLYEYLPPGVYRIIVRDATGCEKTIDAEITLDPSVYVPNVFTPNDDNVNDTFEILNLPLTGQHRLIVSNRWGNEVFKSNDYRDGNFWNASDASDGIYFYRLQVDGGETYTGWVEIIRGNKP